MSKDEKIRLSYSKVKVYECPRKYYYQYVQKLPHDSNARNTLPGRAIQKLFELFINGQHYRNGSKWLYANVNKIFESEYNSQKNATKFHVNETYQNVLDEVIDMIPNCYDLFVRKEWNRGTVQSEVWFQAEVTNNIFLVGQVDFIVTNGTEANIIDFKSTAKGLKTLDKEQLIIYNYLYFKRYGKYPTNTYFFLTRDNKLVRAKVTQKDVDTLIEKLKKVADGIKNNNFRINPKKDTCLFCSFKVACWGSARKCPW